MTERRPSTAPYPLPRRSARVAVAEIGAGLHTSLWMAGMASLRVVAWTVAIAVAVAALYLVKSALGIDLTPGPSLLHDLLYPLLQR